MIRNSASVGAARARNIGAGASEADILLFVDADVIVHPDVPRRVLDAFARDPGLDALFGAYDQTPPAGSTISRYRNLLHHLTHAAAPGPAGTFWTGLGAVRRDAFHRAGGFRTEWEHIEDVEFGLRLTAAGGRIACDPGIMGTHLKTWTPRSMVRTDFWGRAVPWTRLILLGRTRRGRLNTSPRHQLAAAGAIGSLAALAVAPVWPWALVGVLLGLAVFLAGSLQVLRGLARIAGPGFALRALPWHFLHIATAACGYIYARLRHAGPRRG